MKTKYNIAIAIATLAVLAALCTTASAGDYGSGCPYTNFYNGTLENGGDIYFDVKGHYGSAGATQSYTFEDVPDGRQVVRMYPGIWLGSPSPGRVTEWSLEINGHTDYFNFTEPGSLPFCDLDCPPEDGTGEHCTVSCTGCGVCSVTYNAGPYIVTGDNGVTYWTSEQIYQVGLLAVYENASMEKLQYWVKEGQEYPDTAPYHAYFNESSSSGPIDTGNISAVEYYTYGYPHCPGEGVGGVPTWPDLNGNYIGSPNITKSNNYAPVFYGWTEIPPAYIDAPDNCFLYPTIGNDRMMVPVLGIHYSAESIDLLPPYTEGHDPAPGATDVPSNTGIVVHVKDDGTGVDQSTIAMTVEGAPVAPVITGTAADYTVTYTPGSRFECGQVVNVTVDASDLASPSNVMSTDSYSFTIMSAATPFLIYGWVNDSDSDPVDDPDVTVTNTNTSEIYEVENITTSHYYQVSTSSETVSAGNVLHFVAVKETTTEFDYVVTVADMNRGGFVQNITIDKTPRPDLVVTLVNAYHNSTSADAWFNLTNEIDVTVENTGEVNAGAFNVNLSIDDGFYGEQNVPGLNVGENVTLTFTGWVPVGDECFSNCALTETYQDYNITGVADCNNAVDESDEENNAITIDGEDGRACYNGYTGDEPLENVLHGTLKGHLNFTTGNGTYGGLYSVNVPKYTEYEITIPEGATMELAKLNLYYTWHYETSCPVVEVSITNGTGTYVVPLETSYNDMKCHCPTASWRLPWGNYVYDVTDYITGSGTYIVSVTRTGGSSVCLAASGIVYVYADDNAPTIEYWLNEGADVLIGGRRYDGGYLAWWECINNATFPASTVTDDVATVTLGVVTPWGDSVPDDILSFNEIELGRGVYSGYSNTVDETINGMSMYIGSTNAQLGVNMTDVTAQYLNDSENMVSQADDGDNMMPSNAFLVVEYEEEVETYTISGYTSPAADKVNITNLNKSDVVADRPADYIDPVTGFYNLTLNVPGEVVTGNVLQIIACDVPDNYTSNCNVSDHTVVNAPGEDYNVNLTLNHYCQNYYPSFPYRTWEQSSWSGPAVMQMLVDHYRSEEPTQSYLNATGIAHNQDCNADLPYVDPAGTKWTLNDILHNTSSYGGGRYANYGIGHYTSIEDVLHYICKYQYLGPGSAPAYGDYTNWMVVRGIHTDVKPTYVQDSYTIYGFWINDPYNETLEGPGGIGENTYKTVDQWSSTYHLSLTGVDVNDTYYNEYVAVCEPPEDDNVVVTLATPKPRLADAITPTLAEMPMKVYGIEQLAFERTVKDDEMLKIVKAAIDGVTEELIPYDSEFAEIFAKTTAGAPKLVTSDIGDYYVVPFNVPVIERPPVKKMPIEIERLDASGDNKFERVKSLTANVVIEPIPIEPIKVEKTLVVVIVDAEDGSFKEASWVTDPVKYLPVSKREALKLALSEAQITSASELSNLSSKPIIELVYRDASPYYPDWKVTVDGTVFYVAQDGMVSS